MNERSVFGNTVAQPGGGATIDRVTAHSASGAERAAEQSVLVTELMQDIVSSPTAHAAAANVSGRGIRPHAVITDELPSGWLWGPTGSNRWVTFNHSVMT